MPIVKYYTAQVCLAQGIAVYENSEIRKKVVTGKFGQCGAAKECGPRTPQQEKQQPHGVEAILKNHERTERYTSMICALVKI